jgi:uncharacterized RDD family membrane protein YckC
LQDNPGGLKRKQEWQVLKEKLEQESQKTFSEAKDTHVPGNSVPPEQAGPEIDMGFFGALPQQSHYAGFWLRALAVIIDSLIFILAGVIIGFILGAMGGSAKSLDIPFFIISWLYYTLMESSTKQATIGKMVLGISVTDLSGNRISFGRATGRYFSKIISGIIFCIGYIMAAFTAKKQALHDIMASTLVIKH